MIGLVDISPDEENEIWGCQMNCLKSQLVNVKSTEIGTFGFQILTLRKRINW